jgi:ribose transport system permease protein
VLPVCRSHQLLETKGTLKLCSSVRFRVIGTYQILNVPLIAWIAIGCFAVFSFIMTKTPFGRHVTLVGGNAVAAFRAGIKVDRLLFISFILAGAIAGLAGWLLAIRTSGATANLGVGMLFHAFAAVVIGGVSLKGGVGRLPGVYAGVLLLSSINTAINLMGLPAHYTQVIQGMLVLAAVLLDTLKLQIRQRFA